MVCIGVYAFVLLIPFFLDYLRKMSPTEKKKKIIPMKFLTNCQQTSNGIAKRKTTHTKKKQQQQITE